MIERSDDINEELMSAVSAFQIEKVKIYLEKGADPNYTVKYDAALSTLNQPDTPLKLVIFRISDCLLDDNDLKEFKTIAELLLKFGADPAPAMIFAEERYGKYSKEIEKNPFSDVWHTIAEADKK